MAKKSEGLRYYATASMTGIIRGYEQKTNKIKTGKNQGENLYNDSFNIHVGENRFMITKKYANNNLSFVNKDGEKTETFLSKDIKKIKEITSSNDESLHTIYVTPYYSTYLDGDNNTKVRKLPEFRGFDKTTKPTESATFIARGIINKIKNKPDESCEVELGFIETSETDTGNMYYYKWFTVIVPEDVKVQFEEWLEVGNFVSVAGRNYNCFNVDEFGHVEGESKTGYYVEKLYPKECKEADDLSDEDTALYKRVKKAEKVDDRVKDEEPVKPVKAKSKVTKRFEEEEDDEV